MEPSERLQILKSALFYLGRRGEIACGSEFRLDSLQTLDSPRAGLAIFCIAACILSKPNIFKSLAYRDARHCWVAKRIKALLYALLDSIHDSFCHFKHVQSNLSLIISLHFLPPIRGNAVQSHTQQNMLKTMT